MEEMPKDYMKPGQDIVMTGYIALSGTIKAVEQKAAILKKTLPQDLLDAAKGFAEYLTEERKETVVSCPGKTACLEVKEGGIFAALWEMAETYKIGLTVYLKKIPIRQETIEICEVLDWNPYELLSGGCMLIAADNGNDIICRLEEAGIPAVFVGKVTDSNDRVILNGENRRYLNRPEPDEIEKLSKGGEAHA